MLFNSHIFIFIFLPVTFFVFYYLNNKNTKVKVIWLILTSCFFYSWWNPKYIIIILTSILINYTIGRYINRNDIYKKNYLWLGVVFNLSLLAYYKYSHFILQNINILLDHSFKFDTIVLPLAISFFTFQQIAYLIDTSRSQLKNTTFLDYVFFVTFFPQLIAGPIVHHTEILPYIKNLHISSLHITRGLTLFILGLFKKVVIADTLMNYVHPLYVNARYGLSITFFESWIGTLSYTFQLYFDFSGYSDMAIGLGLLFGLNLPQNFDSPYQAKNIIQFWRRWHITLSRFLKEYLYIPLGGNRKGPLRKNLNLIITMTLGGLWHGANWTFVMWGSLHGLYLLINHFFNRLTKDVKIIKKNYFTIISGIITFLSVHFAWIFFRSPNIDVAQNIIKGLIGLNGFELTPKLQIIQKAFFFLPITLNADTNIIQGKTQLFFIASCACLAFFFPNTNQIIFSEGTSKRFLCLKMNYRHALGYSLLFTLSLLHLSRVSEFLYFQF